MPRAAHLTSCIALLSLTAAAAEADTCTDTESCDAESDTSTLKSFFNAWPYPKLEQDDNWKVTSSLDHVEHFALRSDWRNPRAKAPLRVLVAPCGQGNDVLHIATQLQEAHLDVNAAPKALGEVVCADLSSVSLASSAARFQDFGLDEYVTILEIDLLTLDPERHGRFDYILSSGVLHHLPSPEAGLRALRRVLTPGGAFGIMVHASHGMQIVDEVHAMLQPALAASPTLEWGEQLAMARALARRLLHRQSGLLRENLENILADDRLTADFYLVPYQRAYSVRQLGALMAAADLCIVRAEPAWRYDVALAQAQTSTMEGPATDEDSSLESTRALNGLSALANASFADEYWAQATNHRFIARPARAPSEIGGLCPPQEPREPTDPSLAPIWAWPEMQEMLPLALRSDNATLRWERLLQLVSPGNFGHLNLDSFASALAWHPAPIREHVARETDALPADAADFVEAADGCKTFAELIGRVPTAADVRMFWTLEAFYGLRLAVLADGKEACEGERRASGS